MKRAAIQASSTPYNVPFLQLESIDPHDTTEHLAWLRGVIGHGPETTPEAFCMLTSHGHAVPSGVDVEAEVAAIHHSRPDDWSQESTQWDGTVVATTRMEQEYLVSPRVSHYGRYMSLLPGESDGEPTRPFQRYGDLGTNHVSWDDVVLRYCDSEDDTDCGSAYEAWAPHRGGALRFRLDDRYAGTQQTVRGVTRFTSRDFQVKVHFTVADGASEPTGEFRIGYHSESGWRTTAPVSITHAMHADAIYTATVDLPDAMFRHGGPGDSDLAIEHEAGARPSVLMVRVIDPDRVEGAIPAP